MIKGAPSVPVSPIKFQAPCIGQVLQKESLRLNQNRATMKKFKCVLLKYDNRKLKF